MGCSSSQLVEEPHTATIVPPAELGKVGNSPSRAVSTYDERGRGESGAEFVEGSGALEDVYLMGNTTKGKLGTNMASIAHVFDGMSFSLSISLPVELLARCIAGLALHCAGNTDLGAVLTVFMQGSIWRIQEGINGGCLPLSLSFLSLPLPSIPVTSSQHPHRFRQYFERQTSEPPPTNFRSSSTSFLCFSVYRRMIPPSMDTEFQRFLRQSERCQEHADEAFRKCSGKEEQIRAVVIACSAIQASGAGGRRNAQIIVTELKGQIRKL